MSTSLASIIVGFILAVIIQFFIFHVLAHDKQWDVNDLVWIIIIGVVLSSVVTPVVNSTLANSNEYNITKIEESYPLVATEQGYIQDNNTVIIQKDNSTEEVDIKDAKVYYIVPSITNVPRLEIANIETKTLKGKVKILYISE